MAFEDSLLALYLGANAPFVRPWGQELACTAGHTVTGGHPGALHVVLAGTVEDAQGWHGPGNHLRGGGPWRVTSDRAVLWSLDQDRAEWNAAATAPLRRAVEASLHAADQALNAALPPQQLPDPTTLCNVDHPEIRRHAAQLMRRTEEQTAEAIFLFVQAMPYRFGVWQERASETLARGSGMCTTKANLQAALLRAAGLEAGFVEMPITMDVLGQQMPSAWLTMMRRQVKHFFGAVKLGGRWHAADSSYTDDSLGVYIRAFPWLSGMERAQLGEGRPFSPIARFNRADPFDIHVVPHLNEAMAKKSRFEPRHFEALNTRLDRLQGSWRRWLPAAARADANVASGQNETARDD